MHRTQIARRQHEISQFNTILDCIDPDTIKDKDIDVQTEAACAMVSNTVKSEEKSIIEHLRS